MTIPRSALTPVILLALVSIALFLSSSEASAAPPEDTCPAIVAKQDLQDLVGDSVETWTVFRGTTSKSFPAEVLAVQDNAWEPEDQIIWAEASGPDIDAIDGIAFGMSGSPVYTASGELVGALAYGLSSNTRVFGITPAYQMTTALPSEEVAPLSRDAKGRIEQATGQSAAGPRRLPTVWSTNARGSLVEKLRDDLQKRGDMLVQSSGSALASPTPLPGASIEAGGVAVNSYALGRTRVSALGTATYVCEDKVLTTGHPTFGDPNARAILSNGDVFSIITEPIWGPFKYGVPTTTVGATLTDNTYGSGSVIGQTLPTIPVVGRVGAFEGTLTEIAKMPINPRGDASSFITPYAASLALANELWKFDDQYNQLASSTGGWTISGVANGEPFSFIRQENAWTGYEDQPANTLYYDLVAIINYGTIYGGTDLRIDSISPDIDIASGLSFYEIQKAEVKVGDGSWSDAKGEVSLRKGEDLLLRLTLQSNGGESIERVISYRGTGEYGENGFLYLDAGSSPSGEGLDGSFAGLLKELNQTNGAKFFPDTKGLEFVEGDLLFDRVVRGSFFLDIRTPSEPFAEIEPLRISGPGKVRLGKKATWRVRISNIGDAMLEGGRFRASGKGINIKRSFDSVAPGESIVEKIVARPKKQGKLQISVAVSGKNVSGQKAAKTVRVVR